MRDFSNIRDSFRNIFLSYAWKFLSEARGYFVKKLMPINLNLFFWMLLAILFQ